MVSGHAKVSIALFVILFAILGTALVFGILGWTEANETTTATTSTDVQLELFENMDAFHVQVRNHMTKMEAFIADNP